MSQHHHFPKWGRQVKDCKVRLRWKAGCEWTGIDDTQNIDEYGLSLKGHCHGVSSTMAAFMMPIAPFLGIDLKYRGCFTFGDSQPQVSNVERHQCLEVSIN